MKMKLISSAFFLVIITFFASSCDKEEDVPEEYLRSGNNLILSTDGNLIIAGYNTGTSSGYDATILKMSSSTGDTLWSKKYGGSYADAFFSIKKSNTGGYIAAGFSNLGASNSPNTYVVITEADGKQVSATKYGSLGHSQGFCILPHSNADSGYLVAGYVLKTGRADRDLYLLRISNTGQKLWEKSIGAIGTNSEDAVNDAAYGIVAAADSGYYITGSLNGYSSCCGKIFLMKVSKNGDSLWTKTYAAGIGYSLTLTSDGGVAIGGSNQETSNYDMIIIKTDANGEVIWSQNYGGQAYEYGASMIETANGGFAITGITNSTGAGYDDMYLVRADATGKMLWDKTYGGSNVDQGFGIVQHPDESFSISGLSNSDGSFIYLNHVDNKGIELWQTKTR
jgi:hypothetical protein